MRLSDFQDGLASALLPPTRRQRTARPAWLDALLAQPGFAVYRNTVAKGCIDALQANYPAVHALVGTDWLRATAHAFVHQHPPTDGRLMGYGAGFADFLEGFGPAANLPYLGAVARLDRCWTESHLAADAPTLQATWLAQQPPEALALLRLQPHPAARWQWCAEHPAYTLWQCQREGLPWDADQPWQGEGTLLTRPHDAVQWAPLPHAGCALLDACAAGATFEDAAAQALARPTPPPTCPRSSRCCCAPAPCAPPNPVERGAPHAHHPFPCRLCAPHPAPERGGCGTAWPSGWSSCTPHSLIALAARLALAGIFWMSGRTKVEGVFTITDTTYLLFREEYKLPLIPPEWAAPMAAVAEHLFPVLLVLGLATRLSALALLGMTLVIQVFVYPDAWPTHLSWAALMLYLAGRGAGSLSLDRWLGLR
jgi:uncharacterized membrane protein YphA (DoxX/SURF4 family)